MYIEVRDELDLVTIYIRTTDIQCVIEETRKVIVGGQSFKLNEESFKKVLDYINHTNKMYYNVFN